MSDIHDGPWQLVVDQLTLITAQKATIETALVDTAGEGYEKLLQRLEALNDLIDEAWFLVECEHSDERLDQCSKLVTNLSERFRKLTNG